MIKDTFLMNLNSFCGNGSIFHAVSGVKVGSCGELGTNLLSTSYREVTFPVNKESRVEPSVVQRLSDFEAKSIT